MSRQPPKLVNRLLLSQAAVILVGMLTLVSVAALVAPKLFRDHLAFTGVASEHVLRHAEEAFRYSFAVAVTSASVAAMIFAGILTFWLVRRFSANVESLAAAAQAVDAGDYEIRAPSGNLTLELEELSTSFNDMARRLEATEVTRGRMLADLAHEMRTPTATLKAYIESMQDGVIPVDDIAWEILQNQVARLQRLGEDLKILSAAQEHQLNLDYMVVEVHSTVRLAVEAARPRFNTKGLTLDYLPYQSPLNARIDSVRLGQVLSNLLDNAWRHTPAGGKVTVSVLAHPGKLSIAVADTGEGIDPDAIDSIFDRFHRADPARVNADGSGSGLGLTIARAIMLEHDGTLTAESRGLGQGALFTVTLPQVH